MEDNFYDRHYYKDVKPASSDKKNCPARTKATNFFIGLIDLKPGKKLLDIGCGDGLFLSALEDKGLDLWGIDISRKITEVAKKRVSKPEQIICKEAGQLPFSDKEFDYITAWGVVEHFPDIAAILREIRRVMKDGAEAIIMVPNAYYYKFIWDTLRQGAGPIKHQEIEALFSFKEWKELIEASGLSVVKTFRHNKFNKSLMSIWLRNIFIPFYFSNHFIFECI